MRKVSLLQMILISIIFLINFSFFLISCIYGGPLLFIFLTVLAHWGNTVYLCFVFSCDISLFFFKSDKLEHINFFMRNTYSIFSFTYEYTVTIGYWFLVLLGDTFMRFDADDVFSLVYLIFQHGGLTVLLLLDLILFEHERIDWSSNHLLIIAGLYGLYFIIVAVSKYVFGINAYPFLYNATIGQLIVCVITFYIILVNSYQAHIWFVKVKNDIAMKMAKKKEYEKGNQSELAESIEKDTMQSNNEPMSD